MESIQLMDSDSPCHVTTFGVTMKFQWDETKNKINVRKHGFDFAEAEEIFRGVLAVEPDMREDYGEKRWRGIGTIRGRTTVVIFTEPAPETIRILSLRKADHEERKEYETAIHDGLEAD
jgi:uncharacterized DUF497 family protein